MSSGKNKCVLIGVCYVAIKTLQFVPKTLFNFEFYRLPGSFSCLFSDALFISKSLFFQNICQFFSRPFKSFSEKVRSNITAMKQCCKNETNTFKEFIVLWSPKSPCLLMFSQGKKFAGNLVFFSCGNHKVEKIA